MMGVQANMKGGAALFALKSAQTRPMAAVSRGSGGTMLKSSEAILTTPREGDLGLARIANRTGLSISLLPNGAIFAIEHTQGTRKIMINQVLGSPIAGGMGRLCLRIGGPEPMVLSLAGPDAPCRIGAADDRFIWQGEQRGLRHRVCLWL